MKSLHSSVVSTLSHATNSKNTTPALSPLVKAIRLSVLGLGLAHGAVNAATIDVTSNLDDGTDCTLREAIFSINGGSVGTTECVSSGTFGNNDSITFSSSLEQTPTITLVNGSLVINNETDVSIDASNISTGITVDGNDSSRVFEVDNATVSMNSMTITGGTSGDSSGGGIAAGNSTVSLSYSTVSGNQAYVSGGGISAASSTVSLSNSTVSRNSTLYNNGGGINAIDSTVSLSNSTVSGNRALFPIFSDGGGILASGSTVRLSNSTVSDNSADFGGGISANSSSTLILNNSIVANSLRDDCYTSSDATIYIDTATIIEDGSCGAVRSGDPGLLPLANNGGATLTHALSPTSIALNSGIFSGAAAPFENCTSEDQRGKARDNGDGTCDVGAFELQPPNQTTNFFVIPFSNGKAVVIPL